MSSVAMAKNILVADDEEGIRQFVCRGLADFGYHPISVPDGLVAWQTIQTMSIDLAIFDIRMPFLSGLDLCKKVRQEQGYRLPIIMLTALGTTDDVIMGLQAGADDYLSKPFKFTELVARIEALLRRSNQKDSVKIYKDISLDSISHCATRAGVVIALSVKEYRLLDYLVSNHGKVVSRAELLSNVWDKDFDTGTNIVDVYIRYLRNKIDVPFGEKVIHTIVGQGYMID